MPLIVVCGYPCSGKSSVVAALVRSLQSLGFLQDLVVLPEPITVTSSGEDPRANVYADSTKERELRGQHKSEVSPHELFYCEVFNSSLIVHGKGRLLPITNNDSETPLALERILIIIEYRRSYFLAYFSPHNHVATANQ